MKYDDADWHEGEAGDSVYAAVHIALLFCWLLDNGYVKEEWMKEWNLGIPLSRKRTPTEYLYDYADGKLIDTMLTPEGKLICDSEYETYMNDYASRKIKGVRYARRDDTPYCGKDTWKSVKALDKYFHKR